VKKFIIILAAMLTTACAGGPGAMGGGEDKYTAAYVNAHIVVGKTTQEEVKALYGVPDKSSQSSSSRTSWNYKKHGALYAIADLVNAAPGSVPGVVSADSALNSAKDASSASGKLNKVMDKSSGNTAVKGDNLSIDFDKNNKVTNWFLY